MTAQANWQRRAQAAETTVCILKSKVKEMYNGGPQTVIHQQLEHAQKREERNRRQRELAEVRTHELQRYSAHLEAEVASRTQAIQTILDNVRFGFLVVDRELAVQEGFTRSCTQLFGTTPTAGQALPALLQATGPVASELLLGMDQVFEDLLPEEVSLDQIPTRFVVGDRVLRVQGSAIRDASNSVTGVLMTVSDVTALEAAERIGREREVVITILRQKGAFEQFIEDTRASLDVAYATENEQSVLRRLVHTIKGNSASWGLSSVVAVAHEVEAQAAIDEAGLRRVEAAVRGYLSQNNALIGVEYDSSNRTFEVQASRLQLLRRLARDPGRAAEVDGWVSDVVRRPASELLGPVGTFVTKLAERLGKDIEFKLSGEHTLVDADIMRPIFRVLPHLVRNAIDHGIEPAWARGEKAALGCLEVSVAADTDSYTLTVVDDGRGVPVDVVGARAAMLGLVTPEQFAQMSSTEKLALIYVDGVSSAEQATDVSGRGVGMAAVREAVREQGGEVTVESSPSGTRVVLRVPLDSAAAILTRSARPGARSNAATCPPQA